MDNLVVSLIYYKKEAKEFWEEIYDIWRGSVEKHLKGEYEFKVEYYEYGNHDEIFHDYFWKCKELNQTKNLFYMDLDTVIVKPTEVFGKYQGLNMFWITIPKVGESFPLRYNSGVRYIEKGLSPDIWRVGENAWKEYWGSNQSTEWAFEQDVYNLMFYAQGRPSERINNSMNYICPVLHMNEIPIDEAHILHFHASKGIIGTLDAMRRWKQS